MITLTLWWCPACVAVVPDSLCTCLRKPLTPKLLSSNFASHNSSKSDHLATCYTRLVSGVLCRAAHTGQWDAEANTALQSISSALPM